MPVNFDKIRAMRDAAGLTQSQAAARAHELDKTKFRGPNAKARWSDIEVGKYPDLQISTLELVAQVLGCQARELLSDIIRGGAARPRRPGRTAGRSRQRET